MIYRLYSHGWLRKINSEPSCAATLPVKVAIGWVTAAAGAEKSKGSCVWVEEAAGRNFPIGANKACACLSLEKESTIKRL